MEIILLEHIEKLGKMGDIVNVKNGFARNYLLPQNKALRATDANKAVFEKQAKVKRKSWWNSDVYTSLNVKEKK